MYLKTLTLAVLSLPILTGMANAQEEQVVAICESPEAAVRGSLLATDDILDIFSRRGCMPVARDVTVEELRSYGMYVEHFGGVNHGERHAFRSATLSNGEDEKYIITIVEEREA